MKFMQVVLIVSIILSFGCGKKLPSDLPKLYPTSLTVLQEGKPLEEATVQLIPENIDTRWAAVGKTNANGIVEFFTEGQYPGVPEGKYTIVIFKTETDPSIYEGQSRPDDMDYGTWDALISSERRKSYRLVEEVYGSLATSPLKLEVGSEKTVVDPIDVGKAIKELLQ